MPSRRKEIRFFDQHFERGLDWYRSFFCSPAEADQYDVIGEISPQYFYSDLAPERIAVTLPDVSLLLILRHPVDRAYSHYGFTVQRGNYRGSFEQFIAERPQALEWGFYSRYAKRFQRHFDKSRMLSLVYEDARRSYEETVVRVATFLGIDPGKFSAESFSRRVNQSSVPRLGAFSSAAVKVGRRLRRAGIEPVVDLVQRLGAQRFIERGGPLPPVNPELRLELSQRFEREFDELEDCLELDLSAWRP